MITCGIISLENEVDFMDFYYPILSYGPICIISVGVFTIITSLIRTISSQAMDSSREEQCWPLFLILTIISFLMQIAVIYFSSEIRCTILSEDFKTGQARLRLLKAIRLNLNPAPKNVILEMKTQKKS